MAVGRLDRDSEGLLLLTTDGMFAEVIRAHTVEKEYWVQVDGEQAMIGSTAESRSTDLQ